MPDEIKLSSVEHEYKRWEVRLGWPLDVVGLSAGTWASTGPNREHTYGMTVMAPAPEHFRQMAAALLEAAEIIETDIANPSEPVEDLYREAFSGEFRETRRAHDELHGCWECGTSDMRGDVCAEHEQMREGTQ